MPLSTIQYMALSALAYEDLSDIVYNGDKNKISKLPIENSSAPQFSGLASLADWVLIDFIPNTTTGFAGAAFKSPSGEIVFSFRGTEPLTLPDIVTDIGVFMQDAYSNISSQLDAAESFVYSILNNAANSSAAYSFTGHSLGGAIASYMTYVTNTDGTPGVGKSVTFNAPGIGGVIEAKHSVDIDPRDYDNLVTDYVNESDLIGNYASNQQLGTTQYIQSRMGSTSETDAVNVVSFIAAMSTLGNLISPLEKLELAKKAAASQANLVKNAIPTANHDMNDMLNAQGGMMPDRNAPTPGSSLVASIAEGTYIAASGAKFAIVTIGDTIGGLIYYGAEGVVKFVNTSGYVISGLTYYGAQGVEKFINTSEYILGGIGYYAIEGAEDFFETAGEGIAEGIWQGYSFGRSIFTNGLSFVGGLFNSAAAAAPIRVDPLILDLDGDGIETTSLISSNAHFDLDANGFAEKTGWVSAHDGILTLDRDGDGKVDNGQELFGDRTVLRDGSIATSGFQALAEFDENEDSIIDENDSVFALLKVWQDLNGDGISTSNELKTLAQLNIESINLGSIVTQVTDVMNNVQRRLGSFTWVGGATGSVGEYLLDRDTSNTHELIDENITIPSDIALLPNLQGSGDISSLHVAMANDTTGQLKDLIEDFIAAPNPSARSLLLPQIIYRWAGVDGLDPTSRGSNIDARQLAVLEHFLGTGFIGTNGTSPNPNAAPILQRAYNELSERIYASLSGYTVTANLINKIDYTTVSNDIVIDLTEVIADIETLLATDRAAGIAMLSEFSRVLKGYELQGLSGFSAFREHFLSKSNEYAAAIDVVGVNTVQGTSNDEGFNASAATLAIAGGAGNDTLSSNGNSQGVSLYGEAGDDTIYGSYGSDLLSGGTGTDYLEGREGNDLYLFGLGDGVDTIYDADATEGNLDVIRFLEGINPADITVRRVGLNLEMSINETTDKLIVENYFGTRYKYSSWYSSYNMSADAHKIEQIRFSDGTVWSIANVKEFARLTTGTDAGEGIVGFSDQDDIIEAGAGADSVYTYEGNDLIYAGAGDDYIDAGAGNDTIYGEAGDDTIYGRAGNDILDGGAGTDYLEGSEGNDTYHFGIGYGVDTIYDADETEGNEDKVVFGAGVSPEDIFVKRVGTNLELSIIGTEDKLIVENYFGTRYKYSSWYSSYYMRAGAHEIEQFIFSNDTVWTPVDIAEKARYTYGTETSEGISGFDDQDDIIAAGAGDDSIYGYAGNDTLHGDAGNDYIDGGTGNDVLYGDEGNDTIYGRAGNDILDGGAGTDYLEGNEGDDTYHFGIGYGEDTIYDADETDNNLDKVIFGTGITPEDVFVKRVGTNLELSLVNTNDKLIIENYFGTRYKYSSWYSSYYMRAGAHEIEQFIFADSTVWTPVDIADKARYIYGTDEAEGLVGFDNQDDIITAGAGDDSLYGYAGNDTLHGNAGNDTVDGGTGDDILYGDQGDDIIYGRSGNDILDGGTGNDTLWGESGDDIYIFGRGYGVDTIVDRDSTEDNQDTIQFAADISPSDILVRRNGNNLELQIIGTDDKLVVEQYFSRYFYSGWYSYDIGEDGNKVEKIVFANGTIWSIADVKEKARDIVGTANDESLVGFDDQDDRVVALGGNDYISTGAGNDVIDAGDGDDTVYAASGNDTLIGGAGNDILYGGYDNDILDGGTGDDKLWGESGDDIYIFGRGYGVDTIIDRDATEGNQDTIQFAADISPSDIRVRRIADNLELQIIGTDDKLIVEQYFSRYFYSGWYSYDVGENGNKVEVIQFADGTTWDIATVLDKARFIDGTDQAETIYGHNTNDVITAGAGDDSVYANWGDDTVNGGDGNDVIYGEYGNDTLHGESGNDSIYGGEGDDILDGGTGTDLLEGGAGNDTYIFGIGYGVDTIYDSDSTENNQDNIQFLEGIAPEDVLVSRSGDNLELSISGTTDKLIVERYFSAYTRNGYYAGSADSNKIEQIEFADGTIWNVADVKEKARNVSGTSGDDYIYGFGDQQNIIAAGDGNDTVYAGSLGDQIDGGSGNDSLFGGYGDDTLTGGTGNDQLEGGHGNDKYIFAAGFGTDTIYDLDTTEGNIDTIQFLEGIDPVDVVAKRDGDDLVLTVTGTNDVLRVDQYFSSYSRNGYYTGGQDTQKVELIEFADGTTWNIADIKDKVRHITGTENSESISGYSDQQDIIFAGAGDDTLYASGNNGDELHGEAGNDSLYGSYGEDLLDGGAGNDILEGGSGNDVYLFGLGYGTDTIYDNDTTADNQDTIQFLLGIAPEDILVKRSGDNLELSIVNTTDKLVVQNYFSGYYRNSGYYAGENANKIEAIEFADGTNWDIATVLDKARHMSGTEEADVISGFSTNDIITAGAGDDTVYAGSGNDVVHGNDGNDQLYGDYGDDQLFGDAGNDMLYGADGNDTLDGGTGNDLLEGSYGNDTYIFGIGYGQDTIYDNDTTEGNVDIVSFLPGVAPTDVSVRRNGDNLELRLVGTEDTLIVERYFSPYARNSWYTYNTNMNKIEEFHFDDGTVWNTAAIADKARYINGTDQADVISGFDTDDIIAAGAGDDTVYASSGNDTVNAGDGNDIVYGDYGDDILRGDAGNDTIYGGDGNDLLDGGTGDDLLEGSYGNDTYVFAIGYGTDTIYDNDTTQGNTDIITFQAGIDPDDIIVKRNGDNLELHIAETTDTLIVERYFSPYARNSWYTYNVNMNKIEQIVFDNGTIWDMLTIADKARYIAGTEIGETISGFDTNDIITAGAGDDTIYASSGDDVVHGNDGNDVLYGDYGNDQLFGDAGNDALYGGEGSDVLDGGTGNDLLEGSSGDDTYKFGIGYGVDTIYDNDTTQGNLDIVNFLPGIAPADVNVRRSGDNLELSIAGTEDMLVVERYFSPYARNSWYTYNVNMNKIEEFHFDDGTVWNIATIQDKARFINGTSGDDSISGYGDWQNVITAGAGNDTIYAAPLGDQIDAGDGNDTVHGSSGDDHIIGGTGNDILEGGAGNDTYVFNPGFGVDTIYDNDSGQGNSLDIVEFTAGIAPEDVIVRRLSNSDLELTIVGTTDKLTIERYFSNYYRNSSWNTGSNSNTIEEFRFADGTIWDIAAIKDKVRFIEGTAGDDYISGFGDQQNIITAGDGNDTVYAASSLYDELYGEGGDDTLIGTWGSEKFDGGMGDDRMEGSAGDDTYVFGPGYGQDVIYDSNQGQGAGLDKVTFLEGIDPADVSVKRLSNSDLEITFAGTTDKLTIERYFSNYYKNSSWNTGADSNVVEELHFADGTIWTTATIKEKVRTIHGTENGETLSGFGDQQNLLYAGAGDDTLYAGGTSGDKLYGESGNDTLFGSWASETLDGGMGDDRMEGSAGDDIYIFGLGYGQDVIYDSNQGQGTNLDKVMFLEGITPNDVTARRLQNSDLELTFAGSADKLTIERYFSNYYRNSSWNTGTDSNAIEEFHFADNTVWNIDDIKTMVRTINGTENGEVLYGYEDADTIAAGGGDDSVYAGYGNDVISGGSGDDILYAEDGNDVLNGGTGNDYLDGGYGDDTYIFSGTFGNDQINDYSGNDLVQFSDLGKDSLVFEQVGNALRITPGGSSDSVSIRYWYSYNDYKVETIKDTSGNTISGSQVEQLIQAMASWSNDNNGVSWSQALSSNSQDVQNIVAQYWTAPTV